MMRSSLQRFLLGLTMVAALEVKVDTNTLICQELEVKMSLTSVCADSGECQLGEEQYVVGSFVYNGLQDLYDDAIDKDSTLVMDATLQLGIVRVTTIRYKLADMIDFPICSAFTASNYNKYGDCPADGRYSFNVPFDFPTPRSSFSEWAASGYEGQIYMKIYFGSDLVGQCVVEASTIATKASNKPSGKIAAVVVVSIVGLLLSYITARCLGAYCARKLIELDAKNVDSETPEMEPTTTYNRFESGGTIYDANHAVALVPLEGPTRSFANGPLI